MRDNIGAAIDRAINVSGRTPDLILSGHVHNYQRFSRKRNGKTIPYVVAGAGGYANELRSLHEVAQDPDTGSKPQTPFKTALSDVLLQAYNDTQPGFLRIRVNPTSIEGEYYTMNFDDAPQGVSDTFLIPLSGK